MKYLKMLPLLLITACAPAVAPEPPMFPYRPAPANFVLPGQTWEMTSPYGTKLTVMVPPNQALKADKDGDIRVEGNQGLLLFNAEDNMVTVGGLVGYSVGMCMVTNAGGQPAGTLYGRYAEGSNLQRLMNYDMKGFEGVCTIRVSGGQAVNTFAQSKHNNQDQ